MQDDVIFRYKNGRIIPIKVNKEQTNNEYMNDKIRGNKKEYTSKDIKVLRSNITGVKGYELNGIYLLKHYGQGVSGNSYGWIINTKENNSLSFSSDYTRAFDEGTAMYVPGYKEGKEKLIELANNKKR